MQEKRGKIVSLFLIFSLLALSGNLYAEKKGAELVIEKKDGKKTRGELIAVKKNSLLLLDSESGADVSIDIENIRAITIVRKSKAFLGAFIGLLTGAFGGAAIGSILEVQDFTQEAFMAIAGAFFGTLGLLTGGIWGARAGIDKTIQIEGKSNSEIKEILEKLRSKARVPDY